jgi:IPT/TIG domain
MIYCLTRHLLRRHTGTPLHRQVKEAGAIFTAMTRETQIIPVVDGFMTIVFTQASPISSNNPKVSAIEIIRVGEHSAHAVTGGPYKAVDIDASGSELVSVDAKGSHTHGVGNELISFTWKEGTTVLGYGKATGLNLTVGDHQVSLTVSDDGGSVHTDTTTISVRLKGFPELFSISPKNGPVAGGTTVTITGQDIGTVTGVRFGRALVTTGITVIDSSTIRVVTIPAPVGVPVPVSVVTKIGESSPATFTYLGYVHLPWLRTHRVCSSGTD